MQLHRQYRKSICNFQKLFFNYFNILLVITYYINEFHVFESSKLLLIPIKV